MNETYQKIWQLAKPYYYEGRPIDIDHIEWMMKEAENVCNREQIDETLLIPLVILHDVGYSKVPKEEQLTFTDIKIVHMKEGKKIAQEILNSVGYDKEKAEKISCYVSVHDNWALGDDAIFQEDEVLAVFGDLDFTWISTKKGFNDLARELKKSHEDMAVWLENSDKLTKRPFRTVTTKRLFERNLNDRRNDIKNKPIFER